MKTCMLCEATSEGTAVTFRKKRDICDWCNDSLTARGSAWCARGQHVATMADMARGKPRCKTCERARSRKDRREYAHAYRVANAERLAAYAARPEVRKRKRDWAYQNYWRNPEKARERDRRRRRQLGPLVRQQRRARYWQRVDTERARTRRRHQRYKIAAWRRMLGGQP